MKRPNALAETHKRDLRIHSQFAITRKTKKTLLSTPTEMKKRGKRFGKGEGRLVRREGGEKADVTV